VKSKPNLVSATMALCSL